MKTRSYHCYFRQDCGQAIVCILIFIGIAALSISAISKIALWRLDATIALINQQRIISDWEDKRIELIKSSFPTNSFKRLNIQNNSLAVLVVPKKDLPVESLRVPVFNIGESENPLFNWDLFLKNNSGSCTKWTGNTCSEVELTDGQSLVRGDIKLETLSLKSGQNVLVSTGEISIASILLEDGATLELLSAFDIYIQELVPSPNSKVFLKAVHGRIRLPSIDSLQCTSDLQVRTSSNQPIQLKNKVLKTSGCSTLSLSDYWQNLRFLGDLSQKTLNSAK